MEVVADTSGNQQNIIRPWGRTILFLKRIFIGEGVACFTVLSRSMILLVILKAWILEQGRVCAASPTVKAPLIW